ncbi:MAG: hypothetical protein P8J27_05890 [Mariniblastus sp.]|nr:hypothetical protein [Mariniblastus sp.]
MSNAKVFFVGQPIEVEHHAAPLRDHLDFEIAEPAQVLEDAQPGDLAVFYSEHFERFRESCKQLKSRNVATLYMIDGILEWRNAWENRLDEIACPYTMRPVLAHKAACIGHSQARILDSWGNAGKTEIIGIPRLDGYRPQAKGGGEKFRILVMTAKTPGFTQAQLDTVKRSLNDLKHWHARNQTINHREVEIVWRLTGNLATEIGVKNQLLDLRGGELRSVLKSVDAVITTPSTAVLEAMLMDLPVAVLDYHNCPHYVASGWDICAADHMDQTICQMADRSESRMLFQQNELADSLQCSESATDRFVELTASMLRIASAQVLENKELEFPPHILTAPPIRLAEFSHPRLYSNAPEFCETDPTLLQIELSHARREVSHLQKELAQVKSELGHAHQIFEQIENHPIAGPIVRIRQRMLDLMNTMRKPKNDFDSSSPAGGTNHPTSEAKPESN